MCFSDGPEWARQRGIIQKVMMHPTAASRYLHMQLPVVRDFVQYLDDKRQPDGTTPNLYEDLFKYTMEGTRDEQNNLTQLHVQLPV